MGILNALGAATNTVAIGSAALSTIPLTKALFTSKQLPKGIAGFVFDIPETENVSLNAQITDHYAEDNFAIQDHVAFDPIKITLVGRIGELIYYRYEYLDYIETVLNRLGPLNVLKPTQSIAVQQSLAIAQRGMSAYESATKVYGDLKQLFSNEPALNMQQKFYKSMSDLFNDRAMITVETPWKTFDNMIIESISADQDNTTTTESTFTITFKQLRVVGTKTNVGLLTGRIKEQAGEELKNGKAPGNDSILTKITTNPTGAVK
jgi:hypothetical protein